MKLIPIERTIKKNKQFLDNPDCAENLQQSIAYYQRVGYHPPWIGYYAKRGKFLVGTAGFKGKPKNGRIEIAYGTFERFRRMGYGTEICGELVKIALSTDPNIGIIARTLPEMNYSTRILQKNGFELIGTVVDEEDGEVWEWKYSSR